MLKPLNHHVLGRHVPDSPKGSLILNIPDHQKCEVQVIAIADDVFDINVGDTVLIKKYSGKDVEVDGENMLLIELKDIMGVFE